MKTTNTKKNRLVVSIFSIGMIGICSSLMADEGVVRISDSNISGEPQLLSVQGVGYSEAGSYVTSGCPSCNNGHGCQNCQSQGGSGHAGKYPADAGWGRPVLNPINRVPVRYLKRWPDSVYGFSKPGPTPYFPTVYRPTDTTQLGFTYQAVPAWQPNPSMLPPMPWPNQWHQRECGYRGCNGYGCSHCQGAVHYGTSNVSYGEVIHESPTPVKTETPKAAPTEVPPAPEANRTQPKLLRKVAVR